MSAVTVWIGTTKGLFTLRGDPSGERLALEGPQLPGEEVPAVLPDKRGGAERVVVASLSMHWGPTVRVSADGGASWSEPADGGLRFPADTDTVLRNTWQLAAAASDAPDTVYAGVEPAALFRSDDGGRSFELVRGLWDHPHRPQWQPGGGGLCLHTVLVHPSDPKRLYVGISTGGVYRTDDGGATWEASNSGIKIDQVPDPYPEFGQCVHKLAFDAGDPDTLYLQNHGGIYRSNDGAASWQSIADGVASDFGFAVVAHPRRSGTAYVIPLDSAMFRWTPEGRPRVFRTVDGGASWQGLSQGLPQHDAYLTVLRDGFAHDGGDPLGLYFGTRTGQVYSSADGGDTWRLQADLLPPVLCVRASA
jgi:photosystem II stability/assembly factor-like uncharacterized protein